MPKGMLLVFTEPPPDFREEFNDWYETEHIPERLAVPGFESARRFVTLDGWRYLALYDLTSPEVLMSSAYLATSGDNNTPWTRRIISRGRFQRFPAVQIFPGDAPTGCCSRLLVIRFAARDEATLHGLDAATEALAASGMRPRIFAAEDALFLLLEGHGDMERQVDFALFGGACAVIDQVTCYVPC